MAPQSRAIGFNHVALEVGDIEEALAFYGRIFDFQLRSKSKTMAFIDLGDQFIALQAGRKQPAESPRAIGSQGGGAVNPRYALLCCRGGSRPGIINCDFLEDR